MNNVAYLLSHWRNFVKNNDEIIQFRHNSFMMYVLMSTQNTDGMYISCREAIYMSAVTCKNDYYNMLNDFIEFGIISIINKTKGKKSRTEIQINSFVGGEELTLWDIEMQTPIADFGFQTNALTVSSTTVAINNTSDYYEEESTYYEHQQVVKTNIVLPTFTAPTITPLYVSELKTAPPIVQPIQPQTQQPPQPPLPPNPPPITPSNTPSNTPPPPTPEPEQVEIKDPPPPPPTEEETEEEEEDKKEQKGKKKKTPIQELFEKPITKRTPKDVANMLWVTFEKTKVTQQQEDEYFNFLRYLLEECPEVLMYKNPITGEQYMKLRGYYVGEFNRKYNIPAPEILEKCRILQYRKDYQKKYTDPYLAIINWKND